eukprot:5973832-Ditylum_brightwellii.AAC.3
MNQNRLIYTKQISPVVPIEVLLVQMAVLKARMCQPLKPAEAYILSNSLLERSNLKEALIRWQQMCLVSASELVKLGKGWWK